MPARYEVHEAVPNRWGLAEYQEGAGGLIVDERLDATMKESGGSQKAETQNVLEAEGNEVPYLWAGQHHMDTRSMGPDGLGKDVACCLRELVPVVEACLLFEVVEESPYSDKGRVLRVVNFRVELDNDGQGGIAKDLVSSVIDERSS